MNKRKKFKTKSDLLKVSPDIYTRYCIGFEMIRKVQGERPCTILDVGGRSGILGDFIKTSKLPYKLTIIDLLPDNEANSTTCDHYITGNFLNKVNLTEKFDFIVSFDVLEHIKNKNLFIKKMLRMAKSIVLTAPFDSLEVRKSERLVNNFFKKYTGKDHPWLKEHFQVDLPKEAWFEGILKKNKFSSVKINSNFLPNWLMFLLPNLIPAFFSVDMSKLSELNTYYNTNFTCLRDLKKPSYRKIYFASKNKLPNIPLYPSPLKKYYIEKNLIFEKMVVDFITENVRERIAIHKKDIKNLTNEISKITKENNRKQQEINERKIEANILKDTNKHILNQLLSIKNSKSWKVAKIISKIYKLPKSSIRYLFNFIKNAINEGPKETLKRISRKFERKEEDKVDINQQYNIWLKNHKINTAYLKNQIKEIDSFKYKPKISIIMPVYNVEEIYLREAIESVILQTYQNWELCIADDASTKSHIRKVLNEYKSKDKRIKVTFRRKNGHISKASNSALKLATGEFIALLDNDDKIYPHTLFKVIEFLNKHPKADFIYSDEDKLELDGRRTDPFFKPDWSPDMFLSANYLCHFTVIRKKLVDKVGGFRVGYEGSQDYDLFLRVTERTKSIYHISDILYSWRRIPESTAANYDIKSYANKASLKALKSAIQRRKIKAEVINGLLPGMFRIKYQIKGTPLISIIIPTKDKIKYLKRCIKSILKKSSYKNYEILIVDTGSTEVKTKRYYKKLKGNKKAKFLTWNKKFNFSAVNNFAAKKAKGKYILFLNNDTEVINSDWIESMLEHAQRREIGAVGAKLLYPNDRIQHAGIILGFGGIAGHAMKYFKDILIGLPYPKDIIRNYAAVTAACMMISKKKFFEVRGFDDKFRIAFNDVDFCLKLYKKGYLNIYTPFTKLYHYESISVGKPSQGTRDMLEFYQETKKMKKKWKNLIERDPYYNPNLTLEKENFSLKI